MQWARALQPPQAVLREHLARGEVAEHAGLAQLRRPSFCEFHCEETLVHDLAEAIHYPGPVEVEASGLIVLERVEAGAAPERFERLLACVPTNRFEERVAGCHPLQVVLLGGLTIGRAARVPIGQLGELPVGLAFVAAQRGGSSGGLEGVGQPARPS